ncbi:hypothetical protein MKW11_14705 [Gluconobacter frateurii]|uniref:hypothetical protein n=1 Tax=Gluconobacter frateurii TaxID=38308 RepID=UPI001F06DAFF|nr:hypothetical protein [Gluconobacter frateurii]UMM08416.1 hypothetical protein MKW11_14705 [Gluconobacter frateurii]
MGERKLIPRLSAEDKREVSRSSIKDTGKREEKELSQGWSASEIKERERKSKFQRNERLRCHFDLVLIIGLWVAAAIVLAVTIVWVANLVLPDSKRWLTTDESGKLQWFVTGIILASTALPRVKKRLD